MEFKFREKYKNLEQYRQPLNYELVGKKLEILLDDFGTCWFDFKSRGPGWILNLGIFTRKMNMK